MVINNKLKYLFDKNNNNNIFNIVNKYENDNNINYNIKYNIIKKKNTKSEQQPVESILQSLKCPISYEIMSDPVITSDGFTYERSSIERWFIDHNTSPMTNKILVNKLLIPNIILRNLIELYN